MSTKKLAICALLSAITLSTMSAHVEAAKSEDLNLIAITPQNPLESLTQYGYRSDQSAFAAPELTQKFYTFWDTSFSNFVWVNGGTIFPNIDLVDAELTNRASMAFEYYDSSNNLIFSDPRINAAGWVVSYYGDYYSKSAKIKLVNKGTSTVYIKSGSVNYWQ